MMTDDELMEVMGQRGRENRRSALAQDAQVYGQHVVDAVVQVGVPRRRGVHRGAEDLAGRADADGHQAYWPPSTRSTRVADHD
jgi:hypothetical protein